MPELLASSGNYRIYSDFGDKITEGTHANSNGGPGSTISFSVEQITPLTTSAWVSIQPIDGSFRDFWDNYWSNKVGGEPADEFAMSTFVSFGSDGTLRDTVSFNLNADSLDELNEEFFFGVWDDHMAQAFGAGPKASAIFTIIDDDGRFEPTGTPSVQGNFWQKQVLTADTSQIMDGDGLGTFSYQWLRNNDVIPFATNANYTTSQSDIGGRISVRVSYTDGAGELEVLTSASTNIFNANDIILGTKGSDTLVGYGGDDVLIGTPLEDTTQTSGAQVYRIYQATLGRHPDSTGFVAWTARIEDGQTIQQVIPGFVNSMEFQRAYGSLDNQAFVNLLYNNVLGRDADIAGLANWTGRLESGASRAEIVYGFSESAEFRNKTSAASNAFVAAELHTSDLLDDVFRLYGATLDRTPDVGGLQSWAMQLALGAEYETVTAGFVNSAEFRMRYGSLDNEPFVNLLYQNVLSRDADATGLASWTSKLDTGESRASVVKGFAQSKEFIAKTSSDFLTFMHGTHGDTLHGGSGDDLMLGSPLADHFVFAKSDTGNDRVLGLDRWDTIELRGFDYDDKAEALQYFKQIGVDSVFSDGGVSVVFANTDLELFQGLTFQL